MVKHEFIANNKRFVICVDTAHSIKYSQIQIESADSFIALGYEALYKIKEKCIEILSSIETQKTSVYKDVTLFQINEFGRTARSLIRFSVGKRRG
jgi:uncharacterized protein (DUF1501 family)